VDHRETGWLAEAYEVGELAEGVEWVVEKADRGKLSTTARNRGVERYEQSRIAKRYLSLYESMA
jgi:glycosyltransferase involved in cell wall biosynthesis